MKTIGDIIRQYGEPYRKQFQPPPQHLKVLDAIAKCRTQALGGHAWCCTSCGGVHIHYNSCGNRHCPGCQAFKKEQWVEARKQELLPVPYLHLVFTIPHELNALVLSNDRLLYTILFKAVWKTVNQLARDERWLGAQTGMIAVLHTWGSNLSLHPHLHCILPCGGLDKNGQWVNTRKKRYFAPNKSVIAPLFRAHFLRLLCMAYEEERLVFYGAAKAYEEVAKLRGLFSSLAKKKWVVYAKQPFGGPAQIINYLSRYTHRIAISNHRIVKVSNGEVVFSYKKYQAQKKDGKAPILQMPLKVMEFIRRFLLHVLPKGFTRIRYYGILATRNRQTKLAAAQRQLHYQPLKVVNLTWQQRLLQLTGIDLRVCPFCGQTTLQSIGGVAATDFNNKAPPVIIQLNPVGTP